MLHSYSVVVPVLDKRDDILATLDSIRASVAFFAKHHPRGDTVRAEVVVVDEGSTDGTLERVQQWMRAESRARLVQHHRSLGIGPARNTGVRVSTGDVLFFCDGDDFFDPGHILVGFTVLDFADSSDPASSTPFRLHVPGVGHVRLSATSPVAALRTGVRIREPILDYWKRVVANTLMQNLCVRRECHEWLEGFPERLVYKIIGGCEDAAFTTWLTTFFQVGRMDLETVEYVRRRGNSLDRQMARFSHPPGSAFDAATPEQRLLNDLRVRFENEKMAYLLDKLLTLQRPDLSPRLLNWPAIRRELVHRGRPDMAARVDDIAEGLARRGGV